MDIESRFPADHAMKAEFDAAAASGSIARLQLFIQRHPDTPLAKEAARLIERLRRTQRN
jgi:outer membrane protein assembly factor BamD (BamD/ComL family)